MATMPTRRIERLYHVGSLEQRHKNTQGPSYEGNGLSVSLHPQEWTAIARLGGNPTWELHKPAGRFLLAHRLTKAQKHGIVLWGLDSGFLEQSVRWEVSYLDVETGDRRWFWCASEAEALAEVQDQEEDDAAARAVSRKKDVVVGTAKLFERIGFGKPDAGDFDLTLTLWVEDCTELDGVWWDDRLDPQALSAPRGVINLKRLSDWSSGKVSEPRIHLR